MNNVTVNNRPLTEHLDKEKLEEVSSHYRGEIARASVDVRTRNTSYSTSRRAVNRSLHDPKAKSSAVRHYTKSEVKIMNTLDKFSQSNIDVYHIIADESAPITIKDLITKYVKKHPGGLSPKSRQTFVTMTNNLVKAGLIEKVTKKGNKWMPHYAKANAYFRLPEGVGPVFQEEKEPTPDPMAIAVAEQKEILDEPVDVRRRREDLDIQEHIAHWMKVNDIMEFSINIKRR